MAPLHAGLPQGIALETPFRITVTVDSADADTIRTPAGVLGITVIAYMSSPDADNPVVLTSVPSEPLAALLIGRLESEGIDAEMSGALTSGFRADAPGDVQILVRPEDATRAGELMAAWQESSSHPSAGDAWFILTDRLGMDVPDPSASALAAATRDVADPTNAADIEHTGACVRYGFDDGPMYVLTYDRSGRLTFEHWADQDFESELVPARSLTDVSPVFAATLMTELGTGAIERVKQQPWVAGV
ncbi:MAG: hypothetical protein H7Z14_01500 [Anaerolineae bacterium]|nr:hypothetical protein [Phycisphaerae bacterium]